MQISCNLCNSNFDNFTAYRTSCNHLICYVCANQAFTAGRSCPVCSSILNQNEVTEVSIGKETTSTITLTDYIFQHILKSREYENIFDELQSCFDTIRNVNGFVLSQLFYELEKASSHSTMLQLELQKYSDERDSIQNEHLQYTENVEKKLAENSERLLHYDKELNELKVAYKEKLRKSQAWEKAYNTLRSQIMEKNPQTLNMETSEWNYLDPKEQIVEKTVHTIPYQNFKSFPKITTSPQPILHPNIPQFSGIPMTKQSTTSIFKKAEFNSYRKLNNANPNMTVVNQNQSSHRNDTYHQTHNRTFEEFRRGSHQALRVPRNESTQQKFFFDNY